MVITIFLVETIVGTHSLLALENERRIFIWVFGFEIYPHNCEPTEEEGSDELHEPTSFDVVDKSVVSRLLYQQCRRHTNRGHHCHT